MNQLCVEACDRPVFCGQCNRCDEHCTHLTRWDTTIDNTIDNTKGGAG